MKRVQKGRTVWYGRFDYVDADGRRQSVSRRARNKTEAQALGAQLAREYAEGKLATKKTPPRTFGELFARYEAEYIVPALYVDDHKIRGLRNPEKRRKELEFLRAFFSDSMPLERLTYGELERFRAIRFTTDTKRKRPPAVGTVNRDLAVLRSMVRIALRDGWIARDPFADGPPLILRSAERKRERVLSREEEARILDLMSAPKRRHYVPLIVALIDTGMRLGEAKSLRWRDVDFERREIRIRALNTKTLTARTVGISRRLEGHLEWLQAQPRADTSPDGLVFRVGDIQNTWKRVRDLAKLPDVRLHDLRHTRATRWIRAGLSLQHVGRLLGHTKAETTYRYVNATEEDVAMSVRLIDEEDARVEGRVN
jgi:integrase